MNDKDVDVPLDLSAPKNNNANMKSFESLQASANSFSRFDGQGPATRPTWKSSCFMHARAVKTRKKKKKENLL
jgi:hypothetical protein